MGTFMTVIQLIRTLRRIWNAWFKTSILTGRATASINAVVKWCYVAMILFQFNLVSTIKTIWSVRNNSKRKKENTRVRDWSQNNWGLIIFIIGKYVTTSIHMFYLVIWILLDAQIAFECALTFGKCVINLNHNQNFDEEMTNSVLIWQLEPQILRPKSNQQSKKENITLFVFTWIMVYLLLIKCFCSRT